MPDEPFAKVYRALAALARGQLIVVADAEDRENEGDLVGAAGLATPETVNFMVREGRGLVCVPLLADRAQALSLPLMPGRNQESFHTAFTLSVDEVSVGTGISAEERARTIAALGDPKKTHLDFRRPGHVFPLLARGRGLAERQGHTEASLELVRAAGLYPAAYICEILNPDGTMARRPQLEAFAEVHGLIYITMEEIITWYTKENFWHPGSGSASPPAASTVS